VAAAAVAVSAAPAAAAPFTETAKIVTPSAMSLSLSGSDVALSQDGTTALIGQPGDNGANGVVWAYTRSGSSWTPQGSLSPSDAVPETAFGQDVSLSADGTQAIVTGPLDNSDAGAVWFFSRSGSTWTQDGPKVTQSGSSLFGLAASMSADGNTALVDSPEVTASDGTLVRAGQVLVYARSGTTWSLQATLTSPDPVNFFNFGFPLALSGDGNTAAITATPGTVLTYTRSGSTWTQGPALPAPSGGGGAGSGFGLGLAMAANGSTLLVGSPTQGANGGAWVYVKTGSTWAPQGPFLVPSDVSTPEVLGSASEELSLSADGNTALLGENQLGPGGAWVFTRSGTTWSQAQPKIFPADQVGAAAFGEAVALSGDGATALVGGPADNNLVGAAWAFSAASAPVVTTQPASVTVTVPATTSFTVACSGTPAPTIQWQVSTNGGVTWTNDTSDAGATTAKLTVSVSTAGTAQYRAVCTNSSGTATSAAATLTAVAPQVSPVSVKSVSPNTGFAFSVVFINGKGFSGVTAVNFGAGHHALFLPISSTLIIALAPFHAPGTVDVTVTTRQGTSPTSTADHFTYR
jgi:hypothetical protein